MPDVTPRDFSDEREQPARTLASRGERLALLYQGILTAIVRIQSGKQPIADVAAFRRQMETLLSEIEREGIKVGYRNADIQDSHYLAIAFLNEVIQRSNDPNRSQFLPLTAKAFPQAVAGEQVFERLNSIRARRDSPELADLLELFYLCFLLGYEGRYGVGGRAELDGLMEDLRDQIERIRGRQTALSPEAALPVRPASERPSGNSDRIWQIAFIICAGFAVVSWVVLRLVIKAYAQGVAGDLGY
ncbi:MAG: type IVB secretion system protein IcmH/DotU [Acidobacteriia bacterium]|nr:type IVB secretion system protein IcmH/DotU [Terriglobia bacterium]